MENPLEGLGLEVSAGLRRLPLPLGLELTYRPPEAVDLTIARVRAQAAFEARDLLATAMQRYGWTADDLPQLLDADRWDEASIFCTAVEVATIVVKTVTRTVGGKVLSVEPTTEVFAWLFKMDDTLGRFWDAVNAANRGLIQPKKEASPSQNGSSAAGANIAGDAGNSAPAPRVRGGKRTAPKGSTARATPRKLKPGA